MTMDAFSPELAHHWLASQMGAEHEQPEASAADELSPAQQVALEDLAERVSAARSVY